MGLWPAHLEGHRSLAVEAQEVPVAASSPLQTSLPWRREYPSAAAARRLLTIFSQRRERLNFRLGFLVIVVIVVAGRRREQLLQDSIDFVGNLLLAAIRTKRRRIEDARGDRGGEGGDDDGSRPRRESVAEGDAAAFIRSRFEG